MKRLIVIIINLVIPIAIFGFDVSVFPDNPKAGEGFLLTISGENSDSYEIIYNNKNYTPFFVEKGKKEIFLPVGIEDSGIKPVKIRKLLVNNANDEKTIELNIKKRVIKVVNLKKTDEKMRHEQPMVDEQQALIVNSLKHVNSDKLWRKAFSMPVQHPISTYFAVKRKGQEYSYYHKGLDFSAPLGSVVQSANFGKVILSRKDLNVYGNSIIVDHGQGVLSCYFHLNKLLKKEGETVLKNETIGSVGSTGWATGPHLHFGVYLQGEAVDPLWWVRFSKQIVERNTPTVVVFNKKRIGIRK